jgi:branched-chain amino acid transport system ATP-binding protein
LSGETQPGETQPGETQPGETQPGETQPGDLTPPTARAKSTNLHRGEAKPGAEKVDPIIVVDGVRRVFGGLTAVDVDHLEIPRNAITALIGPNGAGKTTLFNLLTGFDKPNEGSTAPHWRESPHTRLREWDRCARSS